MAEDSQEKNQPLGGEPSPAEQATAARQNQSVSLPEGWSVPRDHLPAPTYWPVLLGLAVTFIGFGLINHYLIIIIGFILFAVSLTGWIGDWQNEQRELEHERNTEHGQPDQH